MNWNRNADKILTATEKLFIRTGIKNVTMDAIAENANVSKVTLYKYFADKDTLYLAVGRRIFARYTTELESIIASGAVLVKKFYAFLDVIGDFTDSGQFALGQELTEYSRDIELEYERYRQTYHRSMLTLIDAGIENGLLKSALTREMLFHYLDMGIAYYQHNAGYRYKMLNNSGFRQQFLLFYVGNIFVDGTKILPAPNEVS